MPGHDNVEKDQLRDLATIQLSSRGPARCRHGTEALRIQHTRQQQHIDLGVIEDKNRWRGYRSWRALY